MFSLFQRFFGKSANHNFDPNLTTPNESSTSRQETSKPILSDSKSISIKLVRADVSSIVNNHIGSILNTYPNPNHRSIIHSTNTEWLCARSFNHSALVTVSSSWNRFYRDSIRGMRQIPKMSRFRGFIFQSIQNSVHNYELGRIDLNDLKEVGLIGSGSFGFVSHVQVRKSTIGDGKYHGFSNFVIKKVRKDELSEKEAAIMSMVSGHPNVVKYIGETWNSKYRYIGMEYLQGPSLGDLQELVGRFSEHQSHILITEVARGLQHIHFNRVAHLDIKLDNIVLSQPPPSTRIKNCTTLFSGARILDFGLSNVCPGTKAFDSCWMAGGGGSLGYMSPQQRNGTRFVPPKGDVFSLGVVWFVLLTGKMPFNEDFNQYHRSLLYARLLLYDSLVSLETANMVIQCLLFEEDKRPTIQALLQQLESIDPHNLRPRYDISN